MRRRVLVVDDSATARTVLSHTLGKLGYEVKAARDVRETAVLVLDFDPDIVVSDVQLPGIEGDQICRQLKRTMRKGVPIVLYSSLPEEELSARASSANADGYALKLEGVDGLVLRMESLLRMNR